AVLHRREHGAAEQHGAVRILMMPPDHLRYEVLWIAADLADVAYAVEHEAVRAFHRQAHLRAAYVVEREGAVEQADEWTDRSRGVVVLRLREQQRRAAFDVAQIDVIAERRADDPAL